MSERSFVEIRRGGKEGGGGREGNKGGRGGKEMKEKEGERE